MPTLRKKASRFRERAEMLDFLLEVASTIETLDLDELLVSIAELTNRVVPHTLFAILFYNERTKSLSIRYARGHRDEVIRNLTIRLGEGVTGVAAATRQPVRLDDVRVDARYLNALDAVRSELALPMVVRGKLVGVMDLQSTQPAAFTEHDQALLQLMASRMATALDNARLHRRVERTNRTLRLLASLSQEFSSILPLDELLGKLAQQVRTLVNYDAFSVLLLDAESHLLRHRFSLRFDERVTTDNVPLSKGITGAAAASREPIRVRDTAADPRYIASHPGVLSELAVPLIVQDRVVGVLDLESDRLNAFTEEHVRLMTLLAPQVASSVENARLYEELAAREQRMDQDLKAARKLQSVLLPRVVPRAQYLSMALRARPAREIGGDLYDFFTLEDGRFLIAFGDVSGKGAAAALYGALVSGLLRTLVPQESRPSELMKALNESLLERRVDATYVTLTVAIWDAPTRTFTLASAGNLPPMVCRNGRQLELKTEGVPIGLLENREYEDIELPLFDGDVLVLYSDGVQDQQNEADEEYGTARLFKLLRKGCDEPAEWLADQILQDVDRFRGDVPLQDDQTVLVMRVEGERPCKTGSSTK